MKVPFARVDCSGNELSYVREVLESGWLTTAGKAQLLEEQFRERVGARFACAVNSCTAALHLALEAVGVGPGDRVLVPSMTFTATAEVVRYLGADPVFVDVDYGTRLVTREILEKAVEGQRTEDGGRGSEVGGRRSEVGGRRSEVGGRRSEVRSQRSEVGGRRSGKGQGSEDRGQRPDIGHRTSDIRAVIPVHYGGQACEMGGILEFSAEHGMKVVEDAAHAFPAFCLAPSRKGAEGRGPDVGGRRSEVGDRTSDIWLQRSEGQERKAIGAVGDVTCFSFYANKTITTGEGGMLCTDDEEIANRVKVMRLHGINRDIWNRYTDSKPNWEYDVVAPGFKYNMPDVNAAIGLAQLERADAMREARQRCAEFYFEALKNIPFIELPVVHIPFEDHAWHLFSIVIRPEAPVSRNAFIEKMAEAGIGTSVHYKPIHRMTYYRERYGLKPEDFPNTERIWQGTVSLPIYSSMTDSELSYVAETVRRIIMGQRR